MTVKDLIEKLQECNPYSEVKFKGTISAGGKTEVECDYCGKVFTERFEYQELEVDDLTILNVKDYVNIAVIWVE